MSCRVIRYLCLAVLLAVLPSAVCRALQVRDFTFSHLGKGEGMANQRIFSICQTPSGCLWWSSQTGVGRYNGSQVRNYQLDEGMPYGHLGGRVIHVATDSTWIYAFDNRGTVYRFNPVADRFDQLMSLSAKFGHEVALNDICLMGEKLFLAMHDGVFLLQDTTLTPIVKDAYVNKVVPAGQRLLFCAREGVFDEQGRKLLPYNVESGFYDVLTGLLWLGGYENGLHIVKMGGDHQVVSDEFVQLTSNPQHNPIRCFCPYDDETMLVGIDGEGVYQVQRDGKGASSLLFDADDTEHGVLHGNGVYSIVKDTWNNIVVGTYSGGIDIARPIGSTTAIYRHVAGKTQSLLNDHVNAVIPLSDELVLMGTDNGVSIYNFKTGQWRHSCQGTVVLSATKMPDGSVLVSTYGKGVYEIDRQANVTHVYTTHNSYLTDDHVYATCYDKDGGLWVGTLNGDLLYKKGNLSTLTSHPSPLTPHLSPLTYPVHDVQAITQLASGQIAVGTAFGLKFITPGDDRVKDLNYAPSGTTDVNPFVTHLLMAGLELWIATDGGGVYVYHLAKHESRQLTVANGLPSNYVRSLARSNDGRIWIATDKGLSFVMPDKPTEVLNANYCYGLDSEYSRGAVTCLAGGDLLFGTTTGAIVVHPENVQSINYSARLSILGVNCAIDQDKIQERLMKQLLEKGELNLDYDQRTFDLLFESVNMRNHFDIVYRYRVGEGEWSPAFEQQSIRFVNMEPGTHQLTLQCVSRTTGAVIDTLQLTVTIAQPWWNSWWMWCVYTILILLAFYGAWRVYMLQEKYMRLTIDYLQQSQPQPLPVGESEKQAQHGDAEAEVTASLPQDEEKETGQEAKTFVDKATQLILDNLSDTDFGIDQLCREMAMSRTLFYVKLKSFTGKSPQDFVRVIRLERAASLLRSGRSVADAAMLAGFENAKYFSTVFKKYFGVSPSKYEN
jgi:AraC-like DNA-binding protein/ligand-binding sensor domain-containing protein